MMSSMLTELYFGKSISNKESIDINFRSHAVVYHLFKLFVKFQVNSF